MTLPTEIKKIQFPFGTLSEMSNGFLIYHFQEDITLGENDISAMITAHRELSNGTPRYVLVETAARMNTTPAARKLDNTADRRAITKAEAIIVNNIATRIATKFYYSVMPPPYPYKIFKTTLEGYRWLSKMPERSQ